MLLVKAIYYEPRALSPVTSYQNLPKLELKGSIVDKSEKHSFFYGWIVVAACFLCSFSYGLFYTIGVFFKPLQTEFGWSYTLTSSIQSLHFAVFILSTLLVGWSTDKFGPRLTILWGGTLVAAGIGLCSQVNTIGQFFLFYGLASLGSGIIWSLTTATVQRWFIKRRGLVLGLTAAGVGAGTLVYAPISNYLILAHGWRISYIIMAIATWGILMIAAALIRKSPKEKGLKAYGADDIVEQSAITEAKEGSPNLGQAQEWTFREALKTKTFWLISTMYFCCHIPLHMALVHIVPAAINIGIDKSAAAGALAIVGGISIAGRIIMGTSAEKLGWERGLIICCSMCCVAFLWLLGVKNLWMLYTFAIIFGFFYGGKSPLVPGLVGFYFPGKSLATIIGGVHAFSVIGSVIGPLVGGIVFDQTGSYAIAFTVGTAFWAIAVSLLFLVR